MPYTEVTGTIINNSKELGKFQEDQMLDIEKSVPNDKNAPVPGRSEISKEIKLYELYLYTEL